MEAYWLAFIVTLASWTTPMPQHAVGKLVWYGSQNLVEANAEYRGYDLTGYKDRCGVATMSPTDLGKVMWLRAPTRTGWYGPCLAVDVAARIHFARAVYYVNEIVEVSTKVRDLYGFENGIWGEVYVGACPPPLLMLRDAELYSPPLERDIYRPEQRYSFYPYPAQELPDKTCKAGD